MMSSHPPAEAALALSEEHWAEFERTGDPGALNQAVTYLEQACASGQDELPVQARARANLGVALWARFEVTGNLRDLELGIKHLETAVAVIPEDDPVRATALSNLGSALRTRFARSGALTDLDAAVEIGRKAIAVTPEDDPVRATALSNLGSVLREAGRLDEAVSYHQRALALFAEVGDRHGEARAVSNLGSVLREAGRLDEAVSYHQRALALFAEVGDRHSEGVVLNDLGNTYRLLGRLDEAHRAFEHASAQFESVGAFQAADATRKAWLASVETIKHQSPANENDRVELAPATTPRPASAPELADLTAREFEVLTELAKGLTNREIAELLFISEMTVKAHVSRILSKIDARSRVQASAILHRVRSLKPDQQPKPRR